MFFKKNWGDSCPPCYYSRTATTITANMSYTYSSGYNVNGTALSTTEGTKFGPVM